MSEEATPVDTSAAPQKKSGETAVMKQLSGWEKTLSNALANVEALALLEKIGLNAEKISALLKEVSEIQAADAQTNALRGSSRSATQAEQGISKEVSRALADFRDLARSLLVSKATNPGHWETLGLSERISRSVLGFAEQSIQTYSNALASEELLSLLTGEGYSKTTLEAALTKAQALKSADQAQLTAAATSLGATSARDEKLKALRPKMRSFKARARRALAEREDLLKALDLS